MSDTDSFIEEVTEEVRRDKLFGYIRRYGWIAVVAVLLLVGGAAYKEYSKAQNRSAAQARGDAILSALDADDSTARAAALAQIEPDAQTAPIIAMLRSAEARAADDPAAAAETLRAIAEDTTQSQLYRELSALKLAILTASETDPAQRIETLQPLTRPGGPFRVLAEEQIALAEIEKGSTADAIARLKALMEDTESSRGLRQRASQLIVALGGGADPA
ncbi:MAG: tetratricopeptide repeat protein [Rhodobacter sp.]|nr:tetratricopeptide repeat protein [Rhodobacter sp.]